MKIPKRLVTRFLLSAQVIFFGWAYFFGTQGLVSLCRYEHENNEQATQNEHIRQRVASLNKELHAWHTHPFYKEKVAREQLQMAHEGDTIYYLT
jgi:cell division protein FtsB